LVRLLLGQIHLNNYVSIYTAIQEFQYTFLTELFKYLLNQKILSSTEAVAKFIKLLPGLDTAFSEVKSKNPAILGAMAYYKLADKSDVYKNFVQWVSNNKIDEINNLQMVELIEIYDKIYQSSPTKAFIARWYPDDTDPEQTNAIHRYSAIEQLCKKLNLEPIDIGNKIGHTFDIRKEIYQGLKDCKLFIADLTGNRHNVMLEVGYALHSIGESRCVFYFQKTADGDNNKPAFDVSGFRYEEIGDSADIDQKLQPHIKKILDDIKQGKA
jgi:hypothetical protein